MFKYTQKSENALIILGLNFIALLCYEIHLVKVFDWV